MRCDGEDAEPDHEYPEPVDCTVVVEQANLGLRDSTVSRHYRVLREARLIRSVADGRKRIVMVRRDDMEARFPGLLQAVPPVDQPAL
jgi:DNA-binding transcriptional ArsR family regulator